MNPAQSWSLKAKPRTAWVFQCHVERARCTDLGKTRRAVRRHFADPPFASGLMDLCLGTSAHDGFYCEWASPLKTGRTAYGHHGKRGKAGVVHWHFKIRETDP